MTAPIGLQRSPSGAQFQRYAGRTVIALGAHPDDVEVGMGGTVARMVADGVRVLVVAVCVPSHFATRVAEARRSSEILGSSFHLLRDLGCSRVEDMKTYELVAELDRLVAEHDPVALFAHGSAELHKDHRLVFEAFQATLRLGHMDAFCYQPCSCRPGGVAFTPQAFVDIGSTLELKMAAIEAHESQFARRGISPDFQRDLARYYGRQAGYAHAEGLQVLRLKL
jgi:LmbE family N-acetylglucosaminyl deacetylase